MKNYKTYILLFALVLAFSCEKDDGDPVPTSACGVENPGENLPWLKTMIESWKGYPDLYKYMYVLQGEYDGQTVLVISNCCPFCDSTTPVYNCDGQLLWYAPEHPDREITNSKIAWKPDNSECTF